MLQAGGHHVPGDYSALILVTTKVGFSWVGGGLGRRAGHRQGDRMLSGLNSVRDGTEWWGLGEGEKSRPS